MQDHYLILDLSSSAPSDEIRSAYRRKAKELHPDRNPGAGATAQFQKVQAAYEVLSDPEKRAQYDQTLSSSILEDPLQKATEMWSSYIKGVLNEK